jgi:hypothetical protein
MPALKIETRNTTMDVSDGTEQKTVGGVDSVYCIYVLNMEGD